MNLFQRILGTAFPPYRFSVTRKEQATLYTAIINTLPDRFANLKQQLEHTRLMDLRDWSLFPGYKFIEKVYNGESLHRLRKRGENYRICGVTIFSGKTGKEEQVELLINNNLITGLRITNSKYELNEFDLKKINVSNVKTETFDFPPDDLVVFYGNLPTSIKIKLNENDLEEMEWENRTFYSFYDLEDGNYLVMDKKLNVYSFVHDAQPMVKKMNKTLQVILDEISDGTFNQQQHLNQRYSQE